MGLSDAKKRCGTPLGSCTKVSEQYGDVVAWMRAPTASS